MKWLIVTEGAHEVRQFDSTRGPVPVNEEERAGAVEVLVRRLLGRELPVPEVRRISDASVKTIRGRGNGYHRRLVTWLRWAERNDYSFAIVVFDHDNDSDRPRAASDAQDSFEASIPRAVGLAIRNFNAWMLGDQKAIQSLLTANVRYVSRPEDEPDPKEVCERFARESGYEGRMRDLFVDFAKKADLPTIEKHCP